jgi:lysophospholipase L1-like esterase
MKAPVNNMTSLAGVFLASAALFSASETLAAMQSSVESSKAPIVVLGASYAGGWNPGTIAESKVIVRGVSGEQSFLTLERFAKDVVAHRPRAVILWGFINDFFRSAPQESAAVSARVRESYTKMIRLARENGMEPIIATEVTMGFKGGAVDTVKDWVGWVMGKESYQDRINRLVSGTNQTLVEMAKREGVLVLDLQQALNGSGNRRRSEFTADDGSHITAAGYAAITAYAAPLIERHFAGRGAQSSR